MKAPCFKSEIHFKAPHQNSKLEKGLLENLFGVPVLQVEDVVCEVWG